MNCVFWSMGDVSLQGMGHLHKVPGVLPMSPDNSVTHVSGLHRPRPNPAFYWTRGHVAATKVGGTNCRHALMVAVNRPQH